MLFNMMSPCCKVCIRARLGTEAAERPPHVHVVDFLFISFHILFSRFLNTALCSTNNNLQAHDTRQSTHPNHIPFCPHPLFSFLSSLLALFLVTYITPIQSLSPAPPSLPYYTNYTSRQGSTHVYKTAFLFVEEGIDQLNLGVLSLFLFISSVVSLPLVIVR